MLAKPADRARTIGRAELARLMTRLGEAPAATPRVVTEMGADLAAALRLDNIEAVHIYPSTGGWVCDVELRLVPARAPRVLGLNPKAGLPTRPDAENAALAVLAEAARRGGAARNEPQGRIPFRLDGVDIPVPTERVRAAGTPSAPCAAADVAAIRAELFPAGMTEARLGALSLTDRRRLVGALARAAAAGLDAYPRRSA